MVLVGASVPAGCSPPAFVQCALAEMLRTDPAEPPPDTVTVAPAAETVPVDDPCDAADDLAIWVNEAEPSARLIVGTNKQRGLIVYALDGTVVSRHDAGRMNTSVDSSNPAICGHRKSGHFRRPETGVEFYFMDSCARKDVSSNPGPPGP